VKILLKMQGAEDVKCFPVDIILLPGDIMDDDIAAYTADVGLGRVLFTGLKTRDYAQMVGGALLVVVLALVLDLLLVQAKRLITRKLDPSTQIASAKESR